MRKAMMAGVTTLVASFCLAPRPAQARPVTSEEFDVMLKASLPQAGGSSLDADLSRYTGLKPYTQSTNYMSLRGYLWWRSLFGFESLSSVLQELDLNENSSQPDEKPASP